MVSVEWILFEWKETLDCKGGHSIVQSINYRVSYIFFTIGLFKYLCSTLVPLSFSMYVFGVLPDPISLVCYLI